jgi:phosphonatase-like hydrolase
MALASAARFPALVVFDINGTTVQDDGSVPAAIEAALAAEGLRATPADIAAVRGAAKRAAFRRLATEAGRGPEVAVRLYERFVGHVGERYRTEPPRSVSGAAETLAWLRRRGARVAFNTGFERETVTPLLAALGWGSGVVDAVVCGDEVGRGRPAPDMIHEAMRRTAVGDPWRVMVVGDTVLDLEAGAAAGAGWVVGVTSGAHARERLAAAPHTHLLASVAAIPDLLAAAAPG